ncbi:hypothetical protein QFZ94_003537 [Paraburkholderia sp. JPY465]
MNAPAAARIPTERRNAIRCVVVLNVAGAVESAGEAGVVN